MQSTKFRHIIHLYRKKIGLFLLAFCGGMLLHAQQLNTPQYDFKKLHFGFSVSVNSASLQVNRSRYFFQYDTLQSVRSKTFPGISLGAITSFRLGEHFDLRALFPVITFAQRNLTYTFQSGREIPVKIESAYIEGSLLLKYKSVRHRNLRFYLVGGGRYAYDLASTIDQSRSNSKPVVSQVPLSYGYEVGFGFDMYYPYFKFSPELKLFNGLNNVLYKDGYLYSESLNSIYPKMITISFHFE